MIIPWGLAGKFGLPDRANSRIGKLNMLIKGRLLSDPDETPLLGWIRIENEHIAEIGEGEAPGPVDAGSEDAIICPGFVDAHLHLPQIDSIGSEGHDLFQWLKQVIFPAEACWADKAFAQTHALEAHRRLLRAGTLGYAAYLSSHEHALMAISKAAQKIPLRAIAGQVLMDRAAPKELIGHRPARLCRSEKGRLDASLNPRFAPGCSDELLERVGAQAREGFPFSFKQRDEGAMGTRLFIQTHLAESSAECALVKELFPDDPHYAGVYDRYGLLSPQTLLAHCLHLCDEQWKLIADRGCVVVHCPGANTFLGTGLFDLAKARTYCLTLALGSDVAAGCDLAMPRVARAMIEVAKIRKVTLDPKAYVPKPSDAWDLITRGNADALGFSDMGKLEVGASADLLVLQVPFAVDEHLIGKLLYTWREEYITARILKGTLVTDPPS